LLTPIKNARVSLRGKATILSAWPQSTVFRGDLLRRGRLPLQRQIAAMAGRRTWPGKSGGPKKEAPDDKQLGLPV
jgi:hypothetical protein